MRRLALVSVLVCVLAAGCAARKTAFVLVPDREGYVGAVTVTNAKGASTVDRVNEVVFVAGPKAAPAKPVPMDPQVIQRTFGAALAAEPEAPLIVRLYFAKDSAELDSTAAAALQKVVAEIKRRHSQDVSVDGHSDTTGETEANVRISLERANAVRTYLVDAGVSAGWIAVANHGKGNLLIPTADNVDEPRNRRVEVIVR